MPGVGGCSQCCPMPFTKQVLVLASLEEETRAEAHTLGRICSVLCWTWDLEALVLQVDRRPEANTFAQYPC